MRMIESMAENGAALVCPALEKVLKEKGFAYDVNPNKKLGEGGYGAVLPARHTAKDSNSVTSLAVKFIDLTSSLRSRVQEFSKREIQCTCKMKLISVQLLIFVISDAACAAFCRS